MENTVSPAQPIPNTAPHKPVIQATQKPTPQLRPTPQEDSFATASFWLGIISFFISILPVCGLLFGIIAIVLGIKGLESSRNSKSAKIGIVLAILGVVGSILASFVLLYMDVLTRLPL